MMLFIWLLSDIDIAFSFFYGVIASIVVNTFSAYMFMIYIAKSIKEEVRRFYIAVLGKWLISAIMFALIFFNIEDISPLVFFLAFIFANINTLGMFMFKFKI